MPAITYKDWSGGLDRRLPIGVQEADRLWTLKNAYVTLGKRLKKRPGIKLVATGLIGSFGLESISGRLKVFCDTGVAFTPPSIIDRVDLDIPPWTAGGLVKVHYGDLFTGFAYVVAEYGDGTMAHHYVDGAASYISDVNNPRSISVCKAVSRVFAIDGETVKYCAVGAPRDWTTASDAGFLPVGIQQDSKSDCTAVGTFQDALVVFFPEGAQIWGVAVDPSFNGISKRIQGVGSKDPLSLATFSNDLMFLSLFGFRSMTVQALTSRIDDADVGVPVDTLVRPDITTVLDNPTAVKTFGIWIPQFGQYWAIMDMGTSSKVWAYTYSKSSKLAVWSEYTFPIKIESITTLDGKVYARTQDELYEVTDTQYTDNGTMIDVEIQMAFQDAKSPGVLKQVYGADYVVTGSPQVSFKYDPRDLSKESIPQTISGDTRPSDVISVEVCAAAIAPVFRHSADEAFEFDAATFYFNSLGTM